jgi:hypothetical protein
MPAVRVRPGSVRSGSPPARPTSHRLCSKSRRISDRCVSTPRACRAPNRVARSHPRRFAPSRGRNRRRGLPGEHHGGLASWADGRESAGGRAPSLVCAGAIPRRARHRLIDRAERTVRRYRRGADLVAPSGMAWVSDFEPSAPWGLVFGCHPGSAVLREVTGSDCWIRVPSLLFPENQPDRCSSQSKITPPMTVVSSLSSEQFFTSSNVRSVVIGRSV